MFILIHLQVKQKIYKPFFFFSLCVFHVDSRGRSEHARSDKTEERQERDRSREPQKILISDASKTLSLKVGATFFS